MSDIKSFTPLWGVWEIESTIGEGSFGKVYKAVREEFGRRYECAIKHISLPQSDTEIKRLLDDQFSDDKSVASGYYRQIVEDISNEIGIMHSLRGNTNIVAYEDHQIIPKASGIGYDIFIRMELLTELSERVKQSAFTEANAVKMGVDICTALEICAANQLIHRDIKPQNIFINKEGNYKLGDFGVSRQLEKTTSGLSKKGTRPYMAPEVYKGEDYGASADIYSLGLLLYRLLNGYRLPFQPLVPTPLRYDDNEKALAKRMRGEEMPAPAFAGDSLAKVILKMCAFDRNERYHTATEAKNDLLHIANAQEKVVPVGPGSLTDMSDEPSFPPSLSDETEKTESVFKAFCPTCGSPVNDGVHFCSSCGKSLADAEKQTTCEGYYPLPQPSAFPPPPPQPYPLPPQPPGKPNVPVKSKRTAGFLQIIPGVGRLYLGDKKIGLLQLFTSLAYGAGWVWSIIDGIIMLTGKENKQKNTKKTGPPPVILPLPFSEDPNIICSTCGTSNGHGAHVCAGCGIAFAAHKAPPLPPTPTQSLPPPDVKKKRGNKKSSLVQPNSKTKKARTKAILGFILGIIGLFLSVVGGIEFIIGLVIFAIIIVAPLGCVFSVLGLKGEKKGLAIAGIILSAIVFLISITMISSL